MPPVLLFHRQPLSHLPYQALKRDWPCVREISNGKENTTKEP